MQGRCHYYHSIQKVKIIANVVQVPYIFIHLTVYTFDILCNIYTYMWLHDV